MIIIIRNNCYHRRIGENDRDSPLWVAGVRYTRGARRFFLFHVYGSMTSLVPGDFDNGPREQSATAVDVTRPSGGGGRKLPRAPPQPRHRRYRRGVVDGRGRGETRATVGGVSSQTGRPWCPPPPVC